MMNCNGHEFEPVSGCIVGGDAGHTTDRPKSHLRLPSVAMIVSKLPDKNDCESYG